MDGRSSCSQKPMKKAVQFLNVRVVLFQQAKLIVIAIGSWKLKEYVNSSIRSRYLLEQTFGEKTYTYHVVYCALNFAT